MKAMVCTKYGSVDFLQLQEVMKPVIKDTEVLVRILATSVTAADYRIRGLNVPSGFKLLVRLGMGFNKPRNAILGIDFAGEVESVGKEVALFKAGDKVYGSCGGSFGAHAEYKSMDENQLLAIKPSNISLEEAAAFPFGALSALSFLKDKGKIEKGQKVLIYGASGAVGTASIQLAKYFGAEVTGVCSTENLNLVKSLGADEVIDYTVEDFTRNGKLYDIIFDTVGKTSFSQSLKSLNKNGHYLLAVAGLPRYLRLLWTRMTSNKKVIAGIATEHKNDFIFLHELLASGKIKPVIDKCYPFEKIPEAHRYAEQGHKKGSVVIWVGNNSKLNKKGTV